MASRSSRPAVCLLVLGIWCTAPAWSNLPRRTLFGALPVLVAQTARADVITLQQAPLPKAFRDSVVPAAQALKEALEAEEAVGDSFIGEEAEKKLSKLEQKAGQLIQKYGERFISDRGLSDDDPLKKNYVYFLMLEAIDIFEDAVKSEKLPKARKEIIEKLQKVLEVAEQVGVE
ncbi:unnamed protein product [Effrenium voratum]|uniref:Uncharacterized protein n=1 Tax=Effrenium voratum TaxID=2562239 RepID=A0AA36IZV2_9DINO|nr:unnamed protein product [Effrenium voratum]CAJ1395923.1 unnamed protein product [Effrenium voratum]CAJ1440816.1 unnamed protein product [Effrenium voratum]